MFEASLATTKAWTAPLVRHPIRLESYLFCVSFAALFLAIEDGTLDYYYNVILANHGEYWLRWIAGSRYSVEIPAPAVTILVTALNMILYCFGLLHPIYTLILSCIMVLGYAANLYFVFGFAADVYGYVSHSVPDRPFVYALKQLPSIQSWFVFAFFLAIGTGYLAYIGISAAGVHAWRQAKHAKNGAVVAENTAVQEA